METEVNRRSRRGQNSTPRMINDEVCIKNMQFSRTSRKARTYKQQATRTQMRVPRLCNTLIISQNLPVLCTKIRDQSNPRTRAAIGTKKFLWVAVKLFKETSIFLWSYTAVNRACQKATRFPLPPTPALPSLPKQ